MLQLLPWMRQSDGAEASLKSPTKSITVRHFGLEVNATDSPFQTASERSLPK